MGSTTYQTARCQDERTDGWTKRGASEVPSVMCKGDIFKNMGPPRPRVQRPKIERRKGKGGIEHGFDGHLFFLLRHGSFSKEGADDDGTACTHRARTRAHE